MQQDSFHPAHACGHRSAYQRPEDSSHSSRSPLDYLYIHHRCSDNVRGTKRWAHSHPCRSEVPPRIPMRSNHFPSHCTSNRRVALLSSPSIIKLMCQQRQRHAVSDHQKHTGLATAHSRLTRVKIIQMDRTCCTHSPQREEITNAFDEDSDTQRDRQSRRPRNL